MKKKIIVFVCVLFAIVLGIVFYLNTPAKRLQRQLEFAQHYLEDMDYDEAIAAFEAAIDIEPKNDEAYIGLADAYIAINESDKAIEILQTGYESTQSTTIQVKLEELSAQTEKTVDSEELAQTEESTAEQESTVELSLEEQYLQESNELLESGDCLAALETIQDGITETDSDILKEQEQYLKEHIKAFLEDHTIAFEAGKEDNELYLYDVYNYVYAYDENGFPTECVMMVSFHKQDNVEVKKIHFDDQGNTVKTELYDDKNTLGGQYEYTYDGQWNETYYDEQGNVVGTEAFDTENTLNSWYEYTYDTDGLLSKETYYDMNGNLTKETEYIYDEYGNPTLETTYNANGAVIGKKTIEYVYDENGDVQSKTVNDNGTVSSYTYQYGHDSNGNISRVYTYLSGGGIQGAEYVDALGTNTEYMFNLYKISHSQNISNQRTTTMNKENYIYILYP